MTGSASRAGSPIRLLLFAALIAVAIWFALMFAISNDDWVVIRLPTMPWDAAPSVALFEARLSAVMFVSALIGASIASLAWWRANARLRRRFAAEGARSERMESELEALGRLVSSARDREQSTRDGGEQMGRRN
jgi:hypothetical protein